MYDNTKMIRGHWPTPLAKGNLDLDTTDPRRGSSGLDHERQPTRSHTIAKIQKKQSTQKHLDESKERPAKAASTTSTTSTSYLQNRRNLIPTSLHHHQNYIFSGCSDDPKPRTLWPLACKVVSLPAIPPLHFKTLTDLFKTYCRYVCTVCKYRHT